MLLGDIKKTPVTERGPNDQWGYHGPVQAMILMGYYTVSHILELLTNILTGQK